MDLTAPAAPRVHAVAPTRLRGPDVVRAVALIGVVVMNYHGYLILRRSESGADRAAPNWLDRVFDPWDGPLSTRFAATFVLVAGVGVTLLTRRVIGDPNRVREMRWRLVRRGVLLYTVGVILDTIWPGTIILYYGVMFALAAGIFTWRSRWVIATGAIAAIAGTALRLWSVDRNRSGRSTQWLTSPDPDSVRGVVFDVFINGTHPLLPWFTFFCAGIVLGRSLTVARWRTAAAGGGAVLVAGSWVLSSSDTSGLVGAALSIDPYDRSGVYVASALGTALLAYAGIDWLAERFPVATDPLRRAGQLTLSLYLAHIVVFEVLVDWFGWVRPAGTEAALVFAGAFWAVAIVVATWWHRRHGRGPAEYVYRSFGG